MKIARKCYSAARFALFPLLILAALVLLATNASAMPVHKGQHTHKHKRHPHHQKQSSKCVIVVNNEKTVTRGDCRDTHVNVTPVTPTTSTVVPEEHSCEHDPLPGQCVIQCVMSVEVSPGDCSGSVVYPIVVCEEVNTPDGPQPPCSPEVPEKSPCAEKICEPPPEEECPEEKEATGPKG